MMFASPSPCASEPASTSLEVRLLGLVDFDAAMFLMERTADELSRRADRHGALLLCEHPALVTIGREGSRADLPIDSRELSSGQIPVRWISRGGGCVVHSPGQLAVYPIVPLDRLGIGLAEYRQRLEQAAIHVCEDLKLPATRRDDMPGVWCRNGRLASVGIAVKSWIARHGLYLDVASDLRLSRLAMPRSGRVTSLAAERFSASLMRIARSGMVRHLAAQLGYDQHHVFTGHPLLRRTRAIGYVHA